MRGELAREETGEKRSVVASSKLTKGEPILWRFSDAASMLGVSWGAALFLVASTERNEASATIGEAIGDSLEPIDDGWKVAGER